MFGLLVVIGAVVASAFGASALMPAARARRRIRGLPAFAIAAMPEDQPARVIGVVRELDVAPLVAPFSGRRCVYYSVKATTENGVALLSDARSIPFAIDDGTGRALIDPIDAELALIPHLRRHREFLGEHDGELLEQITLRGLRGGKFFEESAILLGQKIAVLGAAVREPDPDARPSGAYRDGAPTRVRLSSSPRFKLVITNDPALTSD